MRKCYIQLTPVHAAPFATFITYSFKIEQIMRGKFLCILFTIGTKKWQKSNQCAHDQWDTEQVQLCKYIRNASQKTSSGYYSTNGQG